MRVSLRLKWMAAHLLVGSLVLLFFVLFLGSQLEGYFEERFENRWKRELELAREFVEAGGEDLRTPVAADRWADRVGDLLGMRFTLMDSAGRVIGDSEVDLSRLQEVENHSDRPEVIEALATGFGKSRRYSTTVGFDLFYLAAPIGSPGGLGGIIRAAVPSSEIDESLSEIKRLIWLATGFGFALVLIAGYATSASLTERVKQMAVTAKLFAQGDFSNRVASGADDEISDLGKALNQMGDDLQRSLVQITQERDQLQTILDGMVEGVMVTDRSGNIVLTNNSFEQIFQVSGDGDLEASSLFRDPDLLEALICASRQSIDTVVSLELSNPVRKALKAHVATLGPADEPVGAVAVFHDTTELQHLEKVRRDFVANVSHELRTPLTAIKGYVETLLDASAIEAEQKNTFLNKVLRHADRMAKLVDDLLNLSKLESFGPETELEQFDLTNVCLRVAENFSGLFRTSNLELKLNLPDAPVLVQGVHAEVESALNNLIENAVKYGGEGENVTVSLADLDDHVQVSIVDQGPGIPVDHQPRIFERFYRVDRGRSRELGGTGLGLSIVKHIVQRHGGRIWVESNLGQGAAFHFTLPRVLNAQAPSGNQ